MKSDPSASTSFLDLAKEEPELSNLYVSKTFLIQRQGETIPLYSSVVFSMEIDEILEKLNDQGYFLDEVLHAFLEFTLFFTADETCQNYDHLSQVQSTTIQIKNIFPSNSFAKPILFQYHTIEFDGVYFSSLDVIISCAYVGYAIRDHKETNALPKSPANHGFWHWIGKKLGFVGTTAADPKLSIREKAYTTAQEVCNMKDFPMEMLWIENTLDNLINLQAVMNQIKEEDPLRGFDQTMPASYVYDAIFFSLNGKELNSHDSSLINLDSRKEIYSNIMIMIKDWLKVPF